MEWEQIDGLMLRAKVPSGWLVRLDYEVIHDTEQQGMRGGWDWRPALTFVPDPNHEWKLEGGVGSGH